MNRGLAGIVLVATLLVLPAGRAVADHTDASFELVPSTNHPVVGQDLTISVYVNSVWAPYGRVKVAMMDFGPKYEMPVNLPLISFDADGSEFPINDGQGIVPAAYRDYQPTDDVNCAYMERDLQADSTGRHYLGKYVFRPLKAGFYDVEVAGVVCGTNIWALQGGETYSGGGTILSLTVINADGTTDTDGTPPTSGSTPRHIQALAQGTKPTPQPPAGNSPPATSQSTSTPAVSASEVLGTATAQPHSRATSPPKDTAVSLTAQPTAYKRVLIPGILVLTLLLTVGAQLWLQGFRRAPKAPDDAQE